MPGPSRFRMLTVTASAVTVTAPVMWYTVWTWRGSGASALLADDRSGAAVLSVIAVVLWCFRWLAILVTSLLTGGAVGYLLDAMLTQRALYRKRLRLSGPLQEAHRGRQAPSASR